MNNPYAEFQAQCFIIYIRGVLLVVFFFERTFKSMSPERRITSQDFAGIKPACVKLKRWILMTRNGPRGVFGKTSFEKKVESYFSAFKHIILNSIVKIA